METQACSLKSKERKLCLATCCNYPVTDKLVVPPSGTVARPPGASLPNLQPRNEREISVVFDIALGAGFRLRVSSTDKKSTRFRGTL